MQLFLTRKSWSCLVQMHKLSYQWNDWLWQNPHSQTLTDSFPIKDLLYIAEDWGLVQRDLISTDLASEKSVRSQRKMRGSHLEKSNILEKFTIPLLWPAARSIEPCSKNLALWVLWVTMMDMTKFFSGSPLCPLFYKGTVFLHPHCL